MVDKKLSFIDHLEELRQRIIVAFLAVAAGAAGCFFFAFSILRILTKPAGKITLVYLSPIEPFMVKFKIALWAGLFLAMPVVLYEALSFVSPALKSKERRYVYPIMAGLVVLFALGVFFGYEVVMPVGIKWLFGQAGQELKANLTASMYVSFAFMFLLAFGVAFETPVVILFLVKLGVVSTQTLRRNWRIAYLAILVISATITPDWSPVTMAIMALPMIVLYEISILISRYI
jgi:sec-independent protein translocase protein TatC